MCPLISQADRDTYDAVKPYLTPVTFLRSAPWIRRLEQCPADSIPAFCPLIFGSPSLIDQQAARSPIGSLTEPFTAIGEDLDFVFFWILPDLLRHIQRSQSTPSPLFTSSSTHCALDRDPSSLPFGYKLRRLISSNLNS